MRLVPGSRVHPVQQLLGGHLHDGRLPPPPPHLLQPQDDRQDQGVNIGKVQVKSVSISVWKLWFNLILPDARCTI